MPTYSNLPHKELTTTSQYFDNYFRKQRGVTVNFYDSAIAFFEKQTGSKEIAATIVAAIIEVVKTQELNPDDLLSDFKKMDQFDLNRYLVTVLNFNRKNSSFLGFRTQRRANVLIDRTLIA